MAVRPGSGAHEAPQETRKTAGRGKRRALIIVLIVLCCALLAAGLFFLYGPWRQQQADGVYRLTTTADTGQTLVVADDTATATVSAHAEDGELGELFRVTGNGAGDELIRSVETGDYLAHDAEGNLTWCADGDDAECAWVFASSFPSGTLILSSDQRGAFGVVASGQDGITLTAGGGTAFSLQSVQLTEFQVVSDLQITTADSIAAARFANALADMKALSPDSAGIVVDGDAVNDATAASYEVVKQLIAQSGLPLDHFTFAMGNHEQQDKEYAADRTRFAEAFGLADAPYYDKRVAGCHFIVLGGDETPSSWMKANLSDSELAWLKGLLDADAAAGVTSYVFIHQPLGSTTSGSFSGNHAYNIDDDAQLAALLSSYANVAVFSGHVHYPASTYRASATSPLFVNTAAVAYIRTLDDEYSSSQGWYAYVYEGRTVLHARDFLAHAWIPGSECTLAAA